MAGRDASRYEKQRGAGTRGRGLKKTHNRVGRFAAAFESIQRQLQLEPHPTAGEAAVLIFSPSLSLSFPSFFPPFSSAVLLLSREDSYVV